MKVSQKKYSISTFMKYLVSYLLLSSVLILGFFLIIRTSLTGDYFDLRCQQTRSQIDILGENLNEELLFFTQIHSSLSKNEQILSSSGNSPDSSNRVVYTELKKYISATKLISSIVYYVPTTGNLIDTQNLTTYQNGIFHINKLPSSGKDSNYSVFLFDPSLYFGAANGQVLSLISGENRLLIYFPATSQNSRRILFYVLDTEVILDHFQSLISEEMPAVALLDGNGNVVAGINDQRLSDYLHDIPTESGIYEYNFSTSICVHTGIANDFSIVSVLSNDLLLEQVNIAFSGLYLGMLSLCVVCLGMIFLVMRITYTPLHKFARKVAPDTTLKHSYLKQLDVAFSETSSENRQLRTTIEEYRLSFQKSQLYTILSPQLTVVGDSLNYSLDRFLKDAGTKTLLVVKVAALTKELDHEEIRSAIIQIMQERNACVLISANQESATYLVSYPSSDSDKHTALILLLKHLYEEHGYFSAVSNRSNTPLDIPFLLESAVQASNSWPQIPVAEYHPQRSEAVPSMQAYPREQIDLLARSLEEKTFARSEQIIADLFRQVDIYIHTRKNTPDFFVRCVVIDILTVVVNSLNNAQIGFSSYNSLYFDTLCMCQYFPYKEKAAEIEENTVKLVHLYEQKVEEKLTDSVYLKQLMEEYYSQEDFSISTLALKMGVGDTYMSHLFKRSMGMNFSDYLWELRLAKSKELLVQTQLSINEISEAVGYSVVSSFRRKFKQETNLTPSQYREQNQQTREF